MARRLTRKDIKRDEVLETLGTGFHFLQEHLRTILWAAVGAVVAVLLVVGWTALQRSREFRANELLGEALRVLEAPLAGEDAAEGAALVFPDAAARRARAAELFEELREDYGGTRPGRVTWLYGGKAAAESGDVEAAREAWERYVARAGEDLFAAQARVNLLALDRERGDAERVEAELEAMLDDEDPPLPKDLVLFELGLTLEALGRDEEASEVFQRLLEEHPRSPFAAAARQRAGAPGPGGFGGLGGA